MTKKIEETYENLIKNFEVDELFNKSIKTMETYRLSIRQFLNWLIGMNIDLENVNKLDVQSYIRHIQKSKNKKGEKRSAVTIHKDFSAISRFLKWLGLNQAVQKISLPSFESKKNTAPESLENKVIRDIAKKVYDDALNKKNWRNAAIVFILIYFGVRVEELISLNFVDIALSERKGGIRVLGKGNKERTIPFPTRKDEDHRVVSELRDVITDYLNQRILIDTKEKALFLSSRGTRISKRQVQTIVTKLGFGVYCHQFRHTFITKLVRRGVDFSLIQSLTGHASMDMVARYSKPSARDKSIAMGMIDYYDED